MASQPSPTLDTAIDIDAVRARLLAEKATRGLSWAQLGAMTGVPQGTLSPFGGGTYAGDNVKLAAAVARWFVSIDDQALLDAEFGPVAPSFLMTSAARKIFGVLRYSQRGKIGAIVTVPGFGKTSACRQYQAERSQVWLATMSPSTQGVPNMLVEVLAAMGEGDAKGTPQQLSRRIRRTVRGTDGLIIIDEAQHLSESSLEELRAIHDDTGIGLVLAGNERVMSRLEGGARKVEFAQLFSRISMRLRIKAVEPGDARLLADAWRVTDEAMIAFLDAIADKPGALRNVTMTLELATLVAAGERVPLAQPHLRDAWAQLSSRPLAA